MPLYSAALSRGQPIFSPPGVFWAATWFPPSTFWVHNRLKFPRCQHLLLAAESALADEKSSATDPQLEL
jgi:hypothetical protein